ncbi:MAG: hypothetical protein IJ754_03190 [Bacteroidaceae bacterium]|nr:hypothetical protein [Bacteroidaceae bacterium]
MKKVYLLFAVLLGLCVSNSAYAQIDEYYSLSRDGFSLDADNPLITDAAQFSSPYSQNDLGSADGGNLSDGVLIDDDKSTFWHSVWSSGSVDPGLHYLQVEMTDDLDPKTLIAFAFARRNVQNDHTIEWLVMGTDDPEASKEECEEIAFVETPFGSRTEALMSQPFERGEYTYLRFYSEKQYSDGGGYGARGYFHISEFNIFPAVEMDPGEQAWKDLDETYKQYQEYQDAFDDRTGTDPGDYSEEAVQAFLDALDGYSSLPTAATVEEIYAVRDAIIATYEAIAPTKVPFTAKNLANGYYRIKAGMMYTNDGEEVEKYMGGSRANGKLWAKWFSPDFGVEEENIQALWKITAVTDTTFDVQSMYHKGRFLPVTRSGNCEMSEECDSLLTFDAVATNHEEEINFVNIRLASQPANDYFYLHQNNHGNGSGTGAVLVGWCTTWDTYEGPKASEWYFEKVPDDEAQAIIDAYDDAADKQKAEFIVMRDKAPGMIEIAKDVATVKLITDAAQMTSPFSQNDLGGGDGGNLRDGVLIDENVSTYWHSVWSASEGNVVPEGRHYLQVEMPADFNAEQQIYMRFTRRDTNNNQIVNWSFEGTNDPEAADGECEVLATFESPWNSGNQTESFKSEYFDTQGFKYIRFYNDGNNAGSAFFHLSEIQLCYDVDNPKSQYVAMGDVAKNLEALIEEFADYDMEAFDVADYERLKPAYDAFVAKYVNPAALRDTIKLAEQRLDKVVEGTNPGFWPAGSKTNLNSTITSAKAYDEAGAYTPAKSSELLASFKEQLTTLAESPIKIKEGKWYRFRFGTEEEFAKYGWGSLNQETGHITGTGNEADWRVVEGDTIGDIPVNEAIFGKYLTVGVRGYEQIDTNDDGTPYNANLVLPVSKEEAAEGTYIFGDDLADIEDPDMALFRFVNISAINGDITGDTIYAIQNKATGLFLTRPTTGGDVRLGIYPALYKQEAFGWGQNSFFSKSIQNTALPPMHLAKSLNILTQWGGNTSGWGEYDGHRGGFYVEEVADVAADYAYGDFKMKFKAGDIYSRCYAVPVTFKNADQATLWTVNSLERTPDAEGATETVKVTLAKITELNVPAGRPFFIVAAGEYDPDAEDEDPVYVDASFKLNLITEPQTANYLKGVFDGGAIQQKFLTAGVGHAEEALAFYDKGTSLADNRAYIVDTDEEAGSFFRKATIEIEFNESLEDGIQTAVKNVSRMGGIYTIDGRFVGNGNLNTISNMPKGAYIINGTKVIVK